MSEDKKQELPESSIDEKAVTETTENTVDSPEISKEVQPEESTDSKEAVVEADVIG
tara:strand:+ start:96 stop:263 length:168 start_codon:yes stop_codon:yes gene_type:complete